MQKGDGRVGGLDKCRLSAELCVKWDVRSQVPFLTQGLGDSDPGAMSTLHTHTPAPHPPSHPLVLVLGPPHPLSFCLPWARRLLTLQVTGWYLEVTIETPLCLVGQLWMLPSPRPQGQRRALRQHSTGPPVPRPLSPRLPDGCRAELGLAGTLVSGPGSRMLHGQVLGLRSVESLVLGEGEMEHVLDQSGQQEGRATMV